MLRRFSVSARVTSLLIILSVFTLLVSGAFVYYMNSIQRESLSELKGTMRSGYERALKYSMQTMASQIQHACEEARQNGTSLEDAVRKVVDPARFEGNNYYFVYDTKGKTIAIPVSPQLIGTNRMDLQDKKGTYILREMIRNAENGGGYLTYWYPKPGQQQSSPKMGYTCMIEGTDYWIGAGVYVDSIQTESQRVAGRLEGIQKSALTTIGITIGVVFLLLILPLAVGIIRSIVVPLRTVTERAGSVSEGNLDIQIKVVGKDEISRLETALSKMVTTLKTNIEQIEVDKAAATEKAKEAEIAAEEARKARLEAERAKSEGMHAAAKQLEAVVAGVTAASREITAQADEIRNGAQVQSGQVAETATAMEEMNATVLEVARNSGQAAEVSTTARDKAQQGADIVNQSIRAMQASQEQSLKLKEKMARLGEQTHSIGSIMNVISDIADQTNLLALNAAIEAARAGDAGRGFAVVADEVRKLAEKTMSATKEVGQSIEAIQEGTNQSIHSVEQAVGDMDKVVTLADESGKVLAEIVTEVESSAEQIQSIATAAEQQSATSEQINRSIEEINRITEETSQGVEQTTNAIQELSSQLGRLGQLVEELKAA